MAEKNSRIGPVVDEWLEADGLILIESWARDGYTVQDIATRIGIAQQTLRAWMNKYPEIKQAVNNGRELVDYKVENALLKAALGYKTKEVRVATIIRNGKVFETQKETIEREAAPNVSACTAWLYNRKPKVWKNMNSRSNILDEIDEDTSIHITVERAGSSEGKNNQAPVVGSSSFEEVDTDWQNDVNKSVTLRGMTEEEKAEARRAAQKKQAEEEENSLFGSKPKTSAKASKKGKASANNAAATPARQDAKAHAQDDDLDYWPDDWEDGDWED